MAGACSGGYIPQIWWSQISGFWEMPKIGGPEKGGIRDHQNSPFSGPPKKRPYFEDLKNGPEKGPKNSVFQDLEKRPISDTERASYSNFFIFFIGLYMKILYPKSSTLLHFTTFATH